MTLADHAFSDRHQSITAAAGEVSAFVPGFTLEPASPLPAADRERLCESPGFGRVHTDHMITLHYTSDRGWSRGALSPYRPLQLDPAAMVLHYGQAIFEGLKAYRQPDGSIKVFRPDRNAARFAGSARRLAMPEMPEALFEAVVRLLVRADSAWVPHKSGESLYIRPLMFASEAALGVRPAQEYTFVLIAGPAASFFSAESEAVDVWVSHEYVRASPGGTGAAKCAGNYAASLVATAEAQSHGCSQVVWLDAVERRYVEELGGMNIFFVRGDTQLITPRLSGALLEGVTRESILVLASEMGLEVAEEDLDVDQWRHECEAGTITEAFACGTAAIVTPIGHVRSSKGDWAVGDGRGGPLAAALRSLLVGIQEGTEPDRFGWMSPAA